MKNLFDVTGRKALVTGGSKGIGRCLATGLHEAGAEVVIFYNSTYPEDLLAEMAKSGPAFHAVKCNVAERSSLDEAVPKAAELLGGRIDILINCAGINRRYWLEDFPLDLWDEVINTNLNGTVYCSQLVGKYMLAQEYGRIVNLASMNTFVAGPKMAAYVASKGAVGQVTKAFANEWGGRGIRVNAIAPGYIATEQTLPLQQDKKRYEEILARIAVGRWGQPEDLLGPVLMLVSDAGSYCNGLVMPIDGGYLAR
ncbi:MAG: SDR family oxidoreductase [Firmicutes bacterium]|nr:SDR family oxidoreductase [Bacillota bacterium]